MTTTTAFRAHPELFPSATQAAATLSHNATIIHDTTDPIEILEQAANAISNANALIERIARDARDNGKTWQEIGDALRMSRQAAQRRFRA